MESCEIIAGDAIFLAGTVGFFWFSEYLKSLQINYIKIIQKGILILLRLEEDPVRKREEDVQV
jgi:multidrug transporter EmrE-like cation transporter